MSRFKTLKELTNTYGIPMATLKIHMEPNGQLYPFRTNAGKVDTSKKMVKQFIELHQRETAVEALSNAPHLLPDADVSMSELADRPFGDIVSQFGTDAKLKGWLDAVKKIEDIEEKKLKNQKARGEVVNREYLEKHVFSYLNTIQSRVLNDLPKTLSIKVINAVESKVSNEDIEGMIRLEISKHFKKSKDKITGVVSG